jgi:hypothetical protein
MKQHGPFICLALPQYERKVDFLGGWSSEHYKRWQMATQMVDMDSMGITVAPVIFVYQTWLQKRMRI